MAEHDEGVTLGEGEREGRRVGETDCSAVLMKSGSPQYKVARQ